MRRRIFYRGMFLVSLLLALSMLDHHFGLLPLGPRFRFRNARAWSPAIRRGESFVDYPLDAQGRSAYRFQGGEWSYILSHLRSRLSFIWRIPCDSALRQMTLGPDGMLYGGRDVDPAAAPVVIELLDDDEKEVRNQAAFAIGTIGDRADRADTSSAIPKLIAMLKGSRNERLNAAFALGQLAPEQKPQFLSSKRLAKATTPKFARSPPKPCTALPRIHFLPTSKRFAIQTRYISRSLCFGRTAVSKSRLDRLIVEQWRRCPGRRGGRAATGRAEK